MVDPAELLHEALRLHQAGRLDEAEALYAALLAAEPMHAHAWQLRGVLANQRGQHENGIAWIRRAIELSGAEPVYLSNLGSALLDADRVDEAIAALEQATTLAPDIRQAWHNLGNALAARGSLPEAAAAYRRALAILPTPGTHSALARVYSRQEQRDFAITHFQAAAELAPNEWTSHFNLGGALKLAGRTDEAINCFGRALVLEPRSTDALRQLGELLYSQRRLPEAQSAYERFIQLAPDNAIAHNNLGVILQDQGRIDAAYGHYCQATRIDPGFLDALNNAGAALRDMGRLDEAADACRAALRLDPRDAAVHANLGAIALDQCRLDAALIEYDRAISLQPDFADAHFNRALVLLLAGDFQRGWPAYEYRTQGVQQVEPRGLTQPEWNGETLAGRSILLYAEQGLGDTLQFIRYAPLVAGRGGRVIVECQAELARLVASVESVEQVVVRGQPLPHVDVQCSLVSLPNIFHTRLETIPADVPYVHVDAASREHWRKRITAPGLRVGLVWQGAPGHRRDRFRSIPLATLAPLGGVNGVALYSLQQGTGIEQLDAWSGPGPPTNLGCEFADAADTAAAMENLDLVITVDSAPAHLAGAIGRNVWVLVPAAPDWRWLTERCDSPWYPTMRLFRQSQLGNWSHVMSELARELAATAQGKPKRRGT